MLKQPWCWTGVGRRGGRTDGQPVALRKTAARWGFSGRQVQDAEQRSNRSRKGGEKGDVTSSMSCPRPHLKKTPGSVDTADNASTYASERSGLGPGRGGRW